MEQNWNIFVQHISKIDLKRNSFFIIIKHFIYLDHVVRYIEDKDGNPMGDECYGTRTNDGFVFLKKIPETDDDIVKIIQK